MLLVPHAIPACGLFRCIDAIAHKDPMFDVSMSRESPQGFGPRIVRRPHLQRNHGWREHARRTPGAESDDQRPQALSCIRNTAMNTRVFGIGR